MEMTFAALAYNSVTKLKPIDIMNGHINNEYPFGQ